MKYCMTKYLSLKIVVMLTACVLLFGCAHDPFKHTGNEVQRTHDVISQKMATADAVAPSVIDRSGVYANLHPLTAEQQATWLHNRVSVNGKNLPFSFLVQRILRNANVTIKYRPNMQKDRLVSLSFTGTIKGALEELANKTHYSYEITNNGHEIVWTAFVTKTFNIAFMPGSATYMMGGKAGTTSQSSTSGTSGTTTSNTGTLAADQQHSEFQATLSLWTDLKNTLDQMKSKEGKVYVSESTTSVTVYDHPTNVETMSDYIDQLNRNMSRQVKLKVQVLELQLDKSHLFGVDWNLVEHWFGTNIGLSAPLVSSSNVSAPAVQQISSPTSPISLQVGTDKNNAILKALGEQGKLSVVTEPSVVTMNNQVAEIRISRDTSYLQSVSQSIVVQGPSTTSLTPGVVTDGFILFLLPKIQDDKVYLQITSTLSTLTALNTIGTQIASGEKGQPVVNTSIQVPTLAEKKFNMRSLIHNGNTLIIGGFRQVRNEMRQSSLFGVKELGGQGSQQQNIETILLITPSIAES